MPRNARIDLPGAVQHLMIRGIEHKRIFWDDLDRDDFWGRLSEEGDVRAECAWKLLHEGPLFPALPGR